MWHISIHYLFRPTNVTNEKLLGVSLEHDLYSVTESMSRVSQLRKLHEGETDGNCTQ